MAELDYQQALAFLQKSSSTNGNSLYEHLTNVILKVLEDKPKDAVDLLETSLLVKKTSIQQRDHLNTVPAQSPADAVKAVATARLFGNAEAPIDPETGEPVETLPPNEYECEDVVADGNLFDAVGAGVGRTETYNVMAALKRLGEDPKLGVATVRFFGKFLGVHGDYYVFETTLQNKPEAPENAVDNGIPLEWNEGTNGYVYFVCSHLGGPMTQLPHVTPGQIKSARQLKKFLTGPLDSAVSSYPVFKGTEANYLRAQIARIAATTVCCPAGYFNRDEEEEEGAGGSLTKNEEYEPQPAREMGNPANWCHRYPHLKAQGRCAVFKREPPEGEEDTFEFTEEEQEEGPGSLAPLESDAEVQGGAAWTPLFSSTNEHVKNQVAGMRSNLWPGAVVACKGSHFASVYVGWGIKNAPFVPLPPPPVAQEFNAALVESVELPPKPQPQAAEDAEAE